MAEEKMEFKAELKQVMDIIVHSLYSHKEIFLRELISNASDAIAKIRFDSLTDTSLTEGDADWKITIVPDKDNNTITISDNGCGLTKEGLIENLGTIARSGTKAFIEKLKQAKDENTVDLIGQFGVGFYSSFMVADKVEVITRAAKEPQGIKWTSTGEDTFTIEEIEKTSRGTAIILHLKEDASEYLEVFRIRNIVKKFSDFVEYPIILCYNEEKEVEVDGEKKTEIEAKEDILNSQQAIWVRPKSEVKDEEYDEFYKLISHDYEKPLKTIHYSAEGTQEFKALLFIPQRKPFDFFMQNSRKGIQLYVNRVFITEECEKLLPNYLEFIRGVIDSSDLPLNVSREMLQEDKQLASIRKAITSKVFSTLKDMLNNEYESYLKFWEEFGVILKSGISSDYANKDKIADLILCKSTRTSANDEESTDYITLEQYVEAMPEDQESIYYMIAESREMVENSPYMEQFKAKGIEVLVLTDPVDEIVVQALGSYKEKSLKAIDRGELEVEKETEAEKELKEKENKDIIEFIKETLGEEVKEVKISNRLKESPACVVGMEGQYGAQMEKLMKEMGADVMKRETVLEINPVHPAITKLKHDLEAGSNKESIGKYIRVIFDAALIAAGEKVKDPSSMLKRIADIISSN